MTRTFGIRREDKNLWERRVPITPEHMASILSSGDLTALVQPSTLRVIPDVDYGAVGARIHEALDAADVVFGVKEMPEAFFLPGRAYVFFSHTIKGQPYNMPMLRRLLSLGCTLCDYERIADDKGRRLVFFSRQAGQAGMIDSLHLLGARLGHEGLKTAFEDVGMAHSYGSLAAIREAFKSIGQRLVTEGLPEDVSPLVVGFAGYGNVSQGAQEVFDLLPHVAVEPEDLLSASLPRCPEQPLVKVVFREEHMVTRRQPGAFDLKEYYERPGEYQGTFSRFLPHLHVLVNGIYWEERYPRLVTLSDLRELWSGPKSPRLRVIGDVSCDLNGSVECTVKTTMPDAPSYVVDAATGEITMGVHGQGPVIMAVDNLPAELSMDSSQWFSQSLHPFVGPLVRADRRVPFERYRLPEALRRAVIAYNGELTPDYQYLAEAL